MNYTRGRTTSSIAVAFKGSKSFLWTLPDIEAGDGVVNITAFDTGVLRGSEESCPFKIIKSPPPPSSDLNSQHWWLIVIIVAVVIVLLPLFLTRRRKAREEEKGQLPPSGRKESPPDG